MGGLVKRRAARVAPNDPKRAHTIIKRAVRMGLSEYHYGRCGPAAIAINRVLFGAKGTYVVAKDKTRWSGHVAVHYGGKLFDYTGQIKFDQLLFFVRMPEDFEVLSDVPEAKVRRHFCGRHVTKDAPEAMEILRLAARHVDKKKGWKKRG